MRKMNKKGFTIVELVIVIAVIAILAGVLIPTFSGIVTKANQSKSLQEVKNAYTETLADDLTENKAVVKDRAIVVAFTGYYVSITDKGAASVVEGSETATHTVEDGKLVCTSHEYEESVCKYCGAAQSAQNGGGNGES